MIVCKYFRGEQRCIYTLFKKHNIPLSNINLNKGICTETMKKIKDEKSVDDYQNLFPAYIVYGCINLIFLLLLFFSRYHAKVFKETSNERN